MHDDDAVRPEPTLAPVPGPGKSTPGSDPPKDSGDPAARRAGDGAPVAPPPGPSAPSEIDRSTDA